MVVAPMDWSDFQRALVPPPEVFGLARSDALARCEPDPSRDHARPLPLATGRL